MKRQRTQACRDASRVGVVKQIRVRTRATGAIYDAYALDDRRQHKGILLPDAVQRPIEIDAVAAADRGLPGLEGIPGKPDARREAFLVVRVHLTSVRRASGGRRRSNQCLSSSATVLSHDDSVGIIGGGRGLARCKAPAGRINYWSQRGIEQEWVEIVQDWVIVMRVL